VQAVLDLLKSADTRANVENDAPLENPWQDFLADLYEETET
jgi:hypothetical protein